MSAFTDSLNTCSSLAKLYLSTNPHLGDAFAKLFLPRLHSVNLCELHLSAIALSQESVPVLCSFLSSFLHCGSLKVLRLNGNNIGLEGVTTILETLKRHNWWLEEFQVHANNLGEGWLSLEGAAKNVLRRNEALRREIETDALQVLHHSRPLLLRSTSVQVDKSHMRLPTELVLQILSYLSAYLSSNQLIRVSNYASDPQTLPPLVASLPSLSRLTPPSHDCVPDPTALPDTPSDTGFTPAPISAKSGPNGVLWHTVERGRSGVGGGCGSCKNSLVCHKEKERQRFLERVECARFELG